MRFHYMDNLRALAMLTGVFFHAAIAYSPLMNDLWPSSDPAKSAALDSVAWFTHLFRMPMFFLIAGFFACYMVEKRGLASFIKNRALRVLLPFVIFLPLVVVSVVASIVWVMTNVENLSPILMFFAMMADAPDAPEPSPSTTHLWFLYNLIQFYIVYSLLHRSTLLNRAWSGVFRSPLFVLVVLPLLLVPALFSQFTPHPAPEQFLPQLWSFGYFGIFFLLGSIMYRDQALIDRIKPYAFWLLGTSIVMYVFVYRSFPQTVSLQDALAWQQGVRPSLAHLPVSILEAYVSVHMTFVCLVVGKALLDRANTTFRFIADSSYWVYIIHLPVLFAIQFRLLDTDWSWWLEFAVSSFGTIGFGLLTYVLVVRRTPIGWMLNGKK